MATDLGWRRKFPFMIKTKQQLSRRTQKDVPGTKLGFPGSTLKALGNDDGSDKNLGCPDLRISGACPPLRRGDAFPFGLAAKSSRLQEGKRRLPHLPCSAFSGSFHSYCRFWPSGHQRC